VNDNEICPHIPAPTRHQFIVKTLIDRVATWVRRRKLIK
jgi:hypothetical protein